MAACHEAGVPRLPPEVLAAVKALACELPAATGVPLARWHLYARTWDGQPPGEDDYVISADEKTSIQARIRRHASLAAAPGRPPRTGSGYTRGGALRYLAAWDVHRAKVFGRCEPATGIEPSGRLVTLVMTTEPWLNQVYFSVIQRKILTVRCHRQQRAKAAPVPVHGAGAVQAS